MLQFTGRASKVKMTIQDAKHVKTELMDQVATGIWRPETKKIRLPMIQYVETKFVEARGHRLFLPARAVSFDEVGAGAN